MSLTAPSLVSEVKADIHDVRRDKTKVSQSATADPAGLDADFMNAARDTGVSESSGCGTADMYDGLKLGNEVKAEMHGVRSDHAVQSAVSESNGPKFGNEAEAEMYEVRRDKTKASQSAGLSGTMEIEHRRNGGIAAGATAGKPQEHQAVQSAVPDLDSLKLGNEVKAEIQDVRRDKTKL